MKFSALLDKLKTQPHAQVTEVGMDGSRSTATFAELHDRVAALAGQLGASGLGRGDLIALQCGTNLDYVIWDLAALRLGATILAIPEEFDLEAATTEAVAHGAGLLASDRPDAAGHGFAVPARVDALPKRLAVRADRARQARPDLHSKVFSSGTAGKLKGLDISRAGTEYIVGEFIATYGIGAADRHLIFLPFSNYQQRMSLYGCIWAGVSLVLTPYQRVFDAIRSERPSFLIAPPVFFDTVLQLHGRSERQSLGEMLGGNVRFLITGMAPTKRATLDAYWNSDLPLYDAYGLTETGMVAWNSQAATRLGSVGRPLDGSHVIFNEDGEIVIRRPHPLSLGYFKADADDDAGTFTPDGIATGDYGAFDGDGFLHLKGRKKDIIVLNNGKKFHPSEVEEHIKRNAPVKDVIVTADRLGSRVVAIVPIAPNDIAAGHQPDVQKRIIKANLALDGYKRVSQVIFTDIDVFRDPRFMTRNLKVNRKAIASFFQ